MSDSEEKQLPQEAETPIYERDKTAKEPVAAPEGETKTPPKAKPKPRKVFVPKKVKVDKPMDRRTRHILVSTREAADLIRQTLADYHKELQAQPAEDPDKEYHDWEKVEKLFSRLAKKYSICSTRSLGGDLGWIYPAMEVDDSLVTRDMVEAIMQTEKDAVPEPVRTRRGYHVFLICETQIHVPKKEKDSDQPPPAPYIPGIPT